MKNNKRKKKLLGVAAALALLAALSGTFAWITTQDQRINRAASAAVSDDTVSIKEDWTPVPLKAGTTATKKVEVENKGNADTFIRVSFEEVLKHLASKGVVKYETVATVPTAKYTFVADDLGFNKNMPVSFDYAKTIADGFVEMTGTGTGTVTGLAANEKAFVKGGESTDPSSGTVSTNLEVKVAYEYTTGQYQSMTVDSNDITPTDKHSSTDGKDWDITLDNLKYGYYEDGYTSSVVNWAKSSLAPVNETSPTGRAVLGTAGERHGVTYDYKVDVPAIPGSPGTPAVEGGLGLTSLPAPAPVATTATDQYPAASAQKGVQADQKGTLGSGIRVEYSANLTDLTTLDSDKWVYNPEDGWFYYTSPLKAPVAGSTTTSPSLIEKLIFDGSMGKPYDNASYDLIVKMEAIYADEDALTASDGWEMGSGTETAKIVAKLKAGL